MKPRRTFVSIVALLVAMVLQTALVTRAHTPGAPPQLLVTVLVVVAMVEGPLSGCVLGFGTGLVVDLLSDHQVGRLALVLTVIGYLCGRVEQGRGSGRSAGRALLTVGAATVGVFAFDAVLGVALGDVRISLVQSFGAALAAAAYDVLLTPFVLPPLRGLLLRLDPERR